ncbi:MAG: type 1 glutamine amidotransferase domain-containing protein [Anaerolineaceae bacterium]
MLLKGKKVAYLIGPEFEDLEFWVPLMRLKEEGATISIVGLEGKKEYHGKHGVPANSDFSAEQVLDQPFDALVIPGGWAPDKLRRSEAVKELVRRMNKDGKIIAMICHAGWVGISAGIVKGHAATGSSAIKDDIINAGGTWRDEPAFRDGNLVWGRVVADIPDFCRELVKALSGSK